MLDRSACVAYYGYRRNKQCYKHGWERGNETWEKKAAIHSFGKNDRGNKSSRRKSDMSAGDGNQRSQESEEIHRKRACSPVTDVHK